MSTPVGILWTLLSILVAGSCCFSMLQPAWLVHPGTRNALGLYSYCVQDAHLRALVQVCGIYRGYFHLSNLPSNWWQATCILYGTGCALLALGALLAITTLCIPSPSDRRVAMVAGYIQCLAVVLLILGLLMFPVGLDSTFIRHYCLDARMYSAGSCHVGWAFMLGMTGAALGMFLPFLSHHTHVRIHSSNYV